jgi:ABC-type antimicrobial peptide transport system permease subunit
MKFNDVLWLGFRGLRERKLRTFLNILGVVIGVGSIVALVSQTTGIQASVLSTLQSLGPTSVLVMPRSQQFTQADVARVMSVPGVETVIPILSSRMTLYSLGQPTTVTVYGVDSEGLVALLGGVRMLDGIIYQPTSSPLAVVGYSNTFPTAQGGTQAIYVGQPLILEQAIGQYTRRVTLQVTGLLQSYGSSLTISIDDAIFLPVDAAMMLFNRRTFNLLLVRAISVDEVANVQDYLTTIYGNNAQVLTIQQLTQTISSIIGQFGILLGSVAAISLTVAGISIMNIMLVTVLERTRVIGILKSIGLKDRDILGLFLSEAIIVGTVGGILGLLTGYAVSLAIPGVVSSFTQSSATQVRGMMPSGSLGAGTTSGMFLSSYTGIITPEIIIAALAVAIGVSVVAGLYPAWRASKLDPIKALRYE